MESMKRAAALLFAVPKGKAAEAEDTEDMDANEALEEALALFGKTMASKDYKAAAKAFRLAMEACEAEAEGEAEGEGGETEEGA